jgi:hypothetical protein
MHEEPSQDLAQLGATRWLAAIALVVSAIALIVMIAMAWTLTPAQQQGIDEARAREAEAKALLARRTAAPGQGDSDRPPREPAAIPNNVPVTRPAHDRSTGQ